jgi:hypothetical protein
MHDGRSLGELDAVGTLTPLGASVADLALPMPLSSAADALAHSTGHGQQPWWQTHRSDCS